MSRARVTITARAQADLNDIRDWYEAIRPALAATFLDEIDAVIDAIGDRPRSFPEVEPSIRRALCRSYPYKVYFVEHPDEVRVLAVYHVSRDPGRWLNR